ncbi:hypothetical protein [Conexibacter sp. SYSU D00693]|uniref:hypothetical protein n=1 Tax=Conexibacter sp. SYSU D00693 TaxID=2812560 RepID=UPI00196AB89A|nr:hypothetical protein [Conexibacter sp. SYSU D00693]
MAVAPPPPTTSTVAAGHQGHVAGTALADAPDTSQRNLPSWRWALLLFLVLAVAYTWIGYVVTIDHHVVVFDALDRLTRAYMVWHNDPPKLAAIGFVFPPVATLALLPFAVVKPLATSLIALPLSSALFAALTVVLLDRTLARCDMAPLLRLPLLALFALNPLWVFYAGNGMSEALYCALLAFSLYAFVSWYTTTEPRFLIAAGFGMSVLVLTRYGFLIWAALLMVLIGVALARRRASKAEVEGSVIAFAAPVFYVTVLWVLFNALIIGDPFGWVDAATSTQAVNATGIDTTGALGLDDVAQRLIELNVAVFPLAFFVVPALLVTFVVQRNDLALWLAAFVVLGVVIIGADALISDNEGLLTLRDALPMTVVSFVGAAWLFRSFPALRPVAWALSAAVLAVGLVTAWQGMRDHPFQSLEQAFTRVIADGEDQQDRPSIGGYTVGIRSEAGMAEYVKRNVRGGDAILTDNSKTFGVIMLSGRPQVFLDRVDRGDSAFRRVLDAPFGRVQYLLMTTRGNDGGDIVAQRYPAAGTGGVDGLDVAYRTDRYVLLRVAARRPGAGPAPSTQGATP